MLKKAKDVPHFDRKKPYQQKDILNTNNWFFGFFCFFSLLILNNAFWILFNFVQLVVATSTKCKGHWSAEGLCSVTQSQNRVLTPVVRETLLVFIEYQHPMGMVRKTEPDSSSDRTRDNRTT